MAHPILLAHISIISLDIKFQKHKDTYDLVVPNVHLTVSHICTLTYPDSLPEKIFPIPNVCSNTQILRFCHLSSEWSALNDMAMMIVSSIKETHQVEKMP